MWTMKHRAIVAVLCGICLIAGASAGAQEVAEGNWISLFNGSDLYGWTQFGDAKWEVEDGALGCTDVRKSWSGFLASTSRFADFELTAKVKVDGDGTAGLVVRGPLCGNASTNGGAQIVLKDTGDWQDIQVKALGTDVSATVNGAAVDGLACTCLRGHIMLQYHRRHGEGRGTKIEMKEIKLRPLKLVSVFNGENLDGWNILPDKASKFSVVDSAINIKDGNGQIETAGLYRDFVLQLDIISNGEHLNSGVFFRGPVGIFWKGYESQVRNQWVKDDRTKPVDFGTGGLYGVRPATEVVVSDHEWFQKTVVADGNHFAVWINGRQVSDFYDTRPAVNNGDGKAGFVPEAGTIHLQGHDPTTDLSFKNIWVGEYPACKCPAAGGTACGR